MQRGKLDSKVCERGSERVGGRNTPMWAYGLEGNGSRGEWDATSNFGNSTLQQLQGNSSTERDKASSYRTCRAIVS